VVRSHIACRTGSAADGNRDHAAHESDESTKDERGYPGLEGRKPRGGRVGAESHYEPHDRSHQARRDRTYCRPFLDLWLCAARLVRDGP
jgi:hypothetical protein